MNLSDYHMNDTAVLQVLLPNGKKSDIEIELYHKHSKKYQAEAGAIARAAAEAGKEESSEYMSAKTNEFLAACTKGWKNLQWEGKEVAFSIEKAIEIYSNPGLGWLRDQVDRFIHRSDNFLGKDKADS